MRMLSVVVVTAMLLSGLVITAEAAQAGKQENINFTMVEVSTTTAKVEDVDYQKRTVTLKDEEGKVSTVKVADHVTNLRQVKRGDTVTMDVDQTITVEVQPGPGDTQNIGSESQTSAPPGQKPSAMRTMEGRLKTRIESIDYDKRTITFKNRKGVLTTYKFGKDAKRFDEVRRGDMLVIDYKETVAVSVK